jgi:hypothetical protein
VAGWDHAYLPDSLLSRLKLPADHNEKLPERLHRDFPDHFDDKGRLRLDFLAQEQPLVMP